MSTSKIEWTEKTWNPVVGCRKVSPGCLNCYAESMSHRLAGMAAKDIQREHNPGKKRVYLDVIQNGEWNGIVRTVPEALAIPLRSSKPTTWFVNSMSDLFYGNEADRKAAESGGYEFTPVPLEFIDKVFVTMAMCPQHTFQILTKRPDRMAEYLSYDFITENHPFNPHRSFGEIPRDRWASLRWPLPNVWLGTSVENQKCKSRIIQLSDVPAVVRFLSLEPLLEDLGVIDLTGIKWVIVGGESGHAARPCYTNWIDRIVEQCTDASVPVFIKQLGSNHRCIDHEWGDVSIKLKDPKGGNITEFPPELQIREFPVMEAAR